MLENYPDLHHCILSDALYNVFCELLNVIEINYYLRRYSRLSKVKTCQNLNHGWCNSESMDTLNISLRTLYNCLKTFPFLGLEG